MQFSYWKNQNFLNLTIAALAGVAIALAALFLKPLVVVMLIVVLIGAVVLVLYPEFGFVGILVLLSSILSEEQIPTIEVGPLLVYATDLLVIALLAIMVIRLLVDSDFKLEKSPMTIPLLAFWGFALLSTILHLLSDEIVIGDGIQEMRIITYYMLFILFIHLIRDKKQLDRFLSLLFFLATITAAANLLQYVLGDSITFLSGRVEEFTTAETQMADVTRITDNPGEGLITTAFIVLTIRLFLSQFKFNNLFHFIQWGIIGGAMLISFNRTHWAVAGISLVVTFFLTSPDQRKKILSWGLSLLWLVPLAFIPALLFPDSSYGELVNAALIRITSLFSSQAYTDPTESTIVWRAFEYRYGLPQIAEHPFFGLGMGADYRPYIEALDGYGSLGPHYTHNGHLWIAMKGGLLSWLSLMVFMVIFIVKGFLNWKKVKDPDMQSLALGFTLVAVSIIIASILHPIIMTLFWTPLLGIIFAINHVIFKFYVQDEKDESQEESLELQEAIE